MGDMFRLSRSLEVRVGGVKNGEGEGAKRRSR